MSFSFSTSGTPKEVIAEVGQQAASQAGVPQGFADSMNSLIGQLPDDYEVTLSANGRTVFDRSTANGQLTLQAQVNYRTLTPGPLREISDVDPAVVQPGPGRFPEGFTADAPPGPGAGEPAAEPPTDRA